MVWIGCLVVVQASRLLSRMQPRLRMQVRRGTRDKLKKQAGRLHHNESKQQPLIHRDSV
jgi:hypothetical protein